MMILLIIMLNIMLKIKYIKANNVENYYEDYIYNDYAEKEEEDSFEKLQRLVEENKRNKESEIYAESENIDSMIETINKYNNDENNKNQEEEKKEYVLTSNNVNKANSIN